MKVSELRQAYLEFFRKRDHRVFPSDSLVPHDDPSLLFTGAGMNQFKPYFLGLKKDLKRATSCQKCLRTADLERVGKTDYHHSFFEMLGNFSFGDYFKKEAIVWGWEFVTKVLKIPESMLWVSVYQDDPDAPKIWKKEVGLPDSKIVRLGPDDNFWPANAPKDGPNGPCGPCSEIYVGETPGKGVEIWNLVFTQFDRQADGSLKPLPQTNIDTGMGLERAASVIQGVKSNFEIDTFMSFRSQLKGLLKKGSNETAHENAAMDHARAAVFAIADGALPSNEGRGYVVRKLVRLGCDHLTTAGSEPGRFKDLVPMVAKIMSDAYPEIDARQKELSLVVENEEKSFLDVLRTQVPRFRELLKKSGEGREELAEIGFKYYDTYGLPFELIQSSAASVGKTIDRAAFEKLMTGQRERSRAASKIGGEIFKKSDLYELAEGLPATRFTGYAATEGRGKLLRVLKGGVFVFDETPFYAESGGQVGDTGLISGHGFEAEVLDTQAHEKMALHQIRVTKGAAEVGKTYELHVNPERRADIMNNHTGTHLLNAALRKVLGEGVKQSGSLVAPDYLRFDFTHFRGVSSDELLKIETLVNEEVHKDTPLKKEEMTKEEAMRSGAVAFFGEKYGDRVRVVTVGDFSKEFCGGTHLNKTGEIKQFKIISESSIQAGVRRIEAVTGRWAEKRAQESQGDLAIYAKEFGCGPEAESVASTVRVKMDRVKELRNSLDSNIAPRLRSSYEVLFKKTARVGQARLFVHAEPLGTPDLFQKTFLHLKNLKEPFVVLWHCGGEEKITFFVGCSDELAAKGFHSGNVVKSIARIVEGNGGGRAEFAVGGGKRADKALEAVAEGERLITESLTQMKEA